jgi:8-oxo-dGTP pyrophosphatase MutT (NUDIX family)
VSNLLLTHVEVYLVTRRPLRVLLLRRSARRRTLPGVWQPVTGKIRRGERTLAAAAREVREETGLSPRRWWTLEGTTVYFDPLMDRTRVLPLFAAEISGRARIKLSSEHDAWQLVSPRRAASLALWDSQRATLRSLSPQLLARPSLARALEVTAFLSPAPRRRRKASRGSQ